MLGESWRKLRISRMSWNAASIHHLFLDLKETISHIILPPPPSPPPLLPYICELVDM